MASIEHTTVAYNNKALPEAFWVGVLHAQQRKIYRHFADALKPQAHWQVLDLGVDASSDKPANYFFESNYPFTERITASGLEDGAGFQRCFPQASYVRASRAERRLPFKDGEFDLVFCSAVVEHVGTRAAQEHFVSEILRVGKRAFITTPNRWYPVEFHTMTPGLHWLPASIYRPLYRKLGFEFFSQEENLNLLSRDELWALVATAQRPRCRLGRHRFLGWTSNYFLIAYERS